MSRSGRVLSRRVRRRLRREQSYLSRVGEFLHRPIAYLARRVGWMLVFPFTIGMAAAFANIEGGWRLGFLFSSLFTLLVANGFARSLHDAEAASLAFLPLSDSQIAHRMWLRRVLRTVPLFALLTLWFGFLTLKMPGARGNLNLWWIALLAAAWQVVHGVALGTIWLAYFPRFRLGAILGLGSVGSMIALLFAGQWLVEPLAPATEWLLLAIPTGWVAGAWNAWIEPTTVPPFVYGTLVVAAAAWLPWAHARMCEAFAIREVEFFGTHGMIALPPDAPEVPSPEMPVPTGLPAEDPLIGTPWEAKLRGIPATAAGVRDTLASVGAEQPGGPLVRLAFGRFSQRERVIVSMIRGIDHEELAWERHYLAAAKWLAILLAIACVTPEFIVRPWIAFVPVALVTFFSAPVLGGIWPGLTEPGDALGAKTLPVGYGEMARVIFRINRVRLFAWLPIALAGSAVAGWKAGLGLDGGMILGGKVALVIIALQPAAVMYQIQQGTKDHTRPLGAVVVALLCLAILAVGVLSVILLLIPEPWPTGAGVVGLFVSAELMYRVGRWRYEHGLVDVDTQPAVEGYWQ